MDLLLYKSLETKKPTITLRINLPYYSGPLGSECQMWVAEPGLIEGGREGVKACLL